MHRKSTVVATMVSLALISGVSAPAAQVLANNTDPAQDIVVEEQSTETGNGTTDAIEDSSVQNSEKAGAEKETASVVEDQQKPEEDNTGAADTNTGTPVMDATSPFKYWQNSDPAEGTLAKDKYGQYVGWTRVYKDGDNASLNGQYNDGEWKSSTGAFDTTNGTLDASSGAYFFRGYFKVDSKDAVTGLHLNFDYKDAAIIYINGQQLAEVNVPSTGYRTTGDASGSHKDNMGYGSKETFSEKQTADLYFRDIKDMLHDGDDNVIAIELHKTNADSDAYFQMNELALNPDESLLPARDSIKAIALSIGSDITQLNVNWYSLAENGGVLEYAKKADMTGSEFPEDKAVQVSAATKDAQAEAYYANKASMNDLEEDTEYVYRVGNNGVWSDVYTTRTCKSGDFSFLFAGDPQLGSSGDLNSDKDGWRNTLDLVKNNALFQDVAFIQNAGDHVEAGDSEIQYDAYLSNYEGSVVYSTPVANAVGNHDKSGQTYNDHFNLPNVSTLGEYNGQSEGDYYYVHNNTLMLVLNSNNESTAEHEQFIKNAMLATKDNKEIKWKIVVFHHSIYSSASHASDGDILNRRDTLAPMFKEAGIDVVLMGHDHVYTRSMLMDGLTPLTDESFVNGDRSKPVNEYTDPNGIIYITANSASGSKYYEFTDNLQGDYIAVKNQEHIANISKLNVTDDQLNIVTYRTTDLSVVDEVTINKTNTGDLESEIKEVTSILDGMDESKYTAESVQALKDSLAYAQKILGKEGVSQDEIDDALHVLQAAKENLKESGNTATEGLKELIDIVNAFLEKQNTGYTQDSLEALTEALNAAQAVLENQNATQQEVDSAFECLLKAFTELKVEEQNSSQPSQPDGSGNHTNTTTNSSTGSPANKAPESTHSTVKTGDTANVYGWFAAIAGAAAAVAAVFVRRRRRAK